VLGVDDFAFLRGQRYGTILVDLETNEPIELLPDRTAATLAAWLREHPGAEVISRDRASNYAEGARQGAPNAVQVADRWHLLQNLTEALGNVLAREQAALREAAIPPNREAAAEPDSDPTAVGPDTTPGTGSRKPVPPAEAVVQPWDRRSRRERERSEQSRERLVALYQEARRLHAEGLTVPQIAQRLGLSPTTVRKYLAAEVFPERKVRNSPPGSVAPYADYLRQRWEAGCHDATQLWREIREQGYTGQVMAVWRYTRRWCAPQARAEPGTQPMAKSPVQPQGDGSVAANPAPRAVVWWLLCPKKRTQAQSAFVERLRTQSPKGCLAHDLVAEFFGLVRGRQAERLEDWMTRAEASELSDLSGFCNGVRRDWEAVIAGLSLEWSNGPVEGQINRLKAIKRQMYGRAGFPLLRARVLRPG
jgi:transposase